MRTRPGPLHGKAPCSDRGLLYSRGQRFRIWIVLPLAMKPPVPVDRPELLQMLNKRGGAPQVELEIVFHGLGDIDGFRRGLSFAGHGVAGTGEDHVILRAIVR